MIRDYGFLSPCGEEILNGGRSKGMSVSVVDATHHSDAAL